MLSADDKESKKKFGKFGKDPTVETSFLPDRYTVHPFLSLSLSLYVVLVLTSELRGAEDTLLVSEKQRNKLRGKGYGSCGFVSRSRSEVILPSDLLLCDLHE